jgi:signal transduction histidine kinase
VRIRTQLTILMLLFAAMLVAVVASAIFTNMLVTQATQQGKLAAAIAGGVSELSYLSNDYMIYREPQQRARWLTRYAMLSEQIAGLSVTAPEEQALVRSVQDSARRIKEVFDSIDASGGVTLRTSETDLMQLQVGWSRMGVQTYGLLADADQLADLLEAKADSATRLRTAFTYVMIGVFGAFFLLNYLTVQRRILRALAALRQGALAIGSGDLDYRIPVDEGLWVGRGRAGDGNVRDEIGELSIAFNAMAARLKQNRAELQAYARRLVDASENERRLIALELHDEVGQVMTALKMSLSRLQRDQTLPPSMVEKLEESKKLADRVIQDLRMLSANLRPAILDDAGLVPALEQHIEQYRTLTGLSVQFAVTGFDSQRLAPEMEINLYRIAQEALTNAARYANPARIDVILERKEREVALLVRDDGCGFDLEEAERKGHLGLRGMRERAEALNGHFAIESGPGKGAKIRVVAPVVAQ